MLDEPTDEWLRVFAQTFGKIAEAIQELAYQVGTVASAINNTKENNDE